MKQLGTETRPGSKFTPAMLALAVLGSVLSYFTTQHMSTEASLVLAGGEAVFVVVLAAFKLWKWAAFLGGLLVGGLAISFLINPLVGLN